MAQRYYSCVYWHFTGSPNGVKWKEVTKPADILSSGSPKSDQDAIDILKSILKTPNPKLEARSFETILELQYGSAQNTLATNKFCCLCDIPIKDLISHSAYYGNVAIGFKAEAIYREEFNPVLYVTPKQLGEPSTNLGYKLVVSNDPVEAQKKWEAHLPSAVKYLTDRYSNELGRLQHLVKITEFSVDDSQTFYREREWRHFGDFNFTVEDVEAVIVPDEFAPDVRAYLDSQGYGSCIPVLTWSLIDRV